VIRGSGIADSLRSPEACLHRALILSTVKPGDEITRNHAMKPNHAGYNGQVEELTRRMEYLLLKESRNFLSCDWMRMGHRSGAPH
jgi:hypothetical protein